LVIFGLSDIPLGSEFVHHFRSSDTVWETGKVLDLESALPKPGFEAYIGGSGELTSWGEPGN